MLDCSITPLRIGSSLNLNLKLVSTVDFFTPSIDNPYMQGQIGCCNVLSDLYALGITTCDNMLMALAVSRDMEEREADVVTSEMLRGFNDTAKLAGTSVTGGQTIRNPWPIIGGVAMAVVDGASIIEPDRLLEGDVMVLTKPLGTQVAVNLHQWLMTENKENLAKVEGVISKEGILSAYATAVESMRTLNLGAATLMQKAKYDVHGCTDVTGFGILGHGSNLAKAAKRSVAIEFDTLPCIKGTAAVDGARSFRLMQGLSAETSGGLLIALPADQAAEFIAELREVSTSGGESEWGWIVGRVVAGVHGSTSASTSEVEADSCSQGQGMCQSHAHDYSMASVAENVRVIEV